MADLREMLRVGPLLILLATGLFAGPSSCSFSLRYPRDYLVLEEPDKLERTAPLPVCRVRFEDRDLAKGETADLEIPQFSVEVFRNESRLSLDEWVERHAPGDTRSHPSGTLFRSDA